MKSSEYFDLPGHWTAADLAAAVPVRLSQLFAFDANLNGPAPACANAAPMRPWRVDYRAEAATPHPFRVH